MATHASWCPCTLCQPNGACAHRNGWPCMLCRTAGEHPYRTASPPTELEPEMPFDGAIYTVEVDHSGDLRFITQDPQLADNLAAMFNVPVQTVPIRRQHRRRGSFGGRCWPPKTVTVEATILKADVMNANGDVFPAEALRPLGWPPHWGTPTERKVSWWRRLWRWIREG